MGLIDVFKSLSTDLSSAVNKSQQHQEENSWERRESNLGLLGGEQTCYLCALQPPRTIHVGTFCGAFVGSVCKTSFCSIDLFFGRQVALVVGEYEHVEDRSAEGILVRVFTPVGKKEQVGNFQPPLL